MGSRSQSTKKHWWNTEEFCLILQWKCITTSLNYCMGISSMQFKQAESFPKDTLSCVVQMWKLWDLSVNFFTLFLWVTVSQWAALPWWVTAKWVCALVKQDIKTFSDVLHVSGVLFEQQDVNAFLLPVLWEPVDVFTRQYGSTSKCFQWQPLILTFAANI